MSNELPSGTSFSDIDPFNNSAGFRELLEMQMQLDDLKGASAQEQSDFIQQIESRARVISRESGGPVVDPYTLMARARMAATLAKHQMSKLTPGGFNE